MSDLIDIIDDLNRVKAMSAVIGRAIGPTAYAIDRSAITGLELLALQIADDIDACVAKIEVIKGERNDHD